MGKREISRHKQFLLLPQCFQKACYPGASKGVVVWKWVNIHGPNFQWWFLFNYYRFSLFNTMLIIITLPKQQNLRLHLNESIFKLTNVTEKLKFAYGWVEMIVEKGGNVGYKHLLFFPQYFQSCLIQRCSKSWLCGKQLKAFVLKVLKTPDCLVKGHYKWCYPFPKQAFVFMCLQNKFWKHCGERRNFETSNFSFSHSGFYLFGELSTIYAKFESLICKLFQFGRV